MQFLIAFIITFIFSYSAAGVIRKKPVPFYISGALISVCAATASLMHIGGEALRKYLIDPFSGGAFAGAFWAVIMLIGALPAGGKLIKRLMPARGELSILAASVSLSHVLTYGVTYIKRLISPNLKATSDFVITCIVCLLLVLIMLPLTVISFKRIRAKFKGKTWKNIQRTAYVFYALIYVHVMVIFIPRARLGQSGYYLSCIAYTAIWSTYFVLRARKAYLKSKKPERKALLNTACTAAAVLCTGVIAFASYGKPQTKLETAEPIVISTKDSPVVFTAAAVQNEAPEEADAVQEEITQEVEQTEPEMIETEQSAQTSLTEVTKVQSEKASTAKRAVSEKSESKTVTTSSEKSTTASTPKETKSTTTSSAQKTETKATAKAATKATSAQTTKAAAKTTTKATTTTAKPAQTTTSKTTTTTTTAAPVYKYNNGTYSDKAYGYDGYIHVTLTIENDRIIAFEAYSDEKSDEDQAYFAKAYGTVGRAIVNSSSYDVDGVSGATISSDAIKMATKKCLKQALK